MTSKKTLRILGVARLSRETDESTSITRQTEHLHAYAASRDATLVHVAADVDVSGAVLPFDRPQFGPWLTDERAGEYDVIAAVKLDRLSRSLSNLVALLDWAREHDKIVIAFQDGIDTSTHTGRLMAGLLGVVAEWERDIIRDRVQDSMRLATREGRFHGGTVPDGYMPVKVVDGWRLVHDAERVELLHEIRRDVIAGKSVNSICQGLNESGTLSPQDHANVRTGKAAKGARWRSESLHKMLRSRATLGESVKKDGTVIRGADGLPVMRAPAIYTQGEWSELQTALDALKATPRRTRQVSPLGGVLFCNVCEAPWYPVRPTDAKSARYRCRSSVNRAGKNFCGNPSAQAVVIDQAINTIMMEELGDTPIVRRDFVKGEDHTAELERVEQAIRDLRDDRDAGLFRGERDAAEYRTRMGSLVTRRDELAALPQRADEWREVPTGDHFWQVWPSIVASANPTARRDFLLASGLRFYVGERPNAATRFMHVRRVPLGAPFTGSGVEYDEDA
ncbi:recombinase family protein [Asanoa iriomotensis]|uniref:Integrase n=1 Tax=Asanoa iriomotensis TaxID=234613 RepID=A0ABQ4CBS0_9ACTN|nr:recombinase family protein [Asanoa iriomotensis]GIF60228.1 integrase [Asanoa iriomotensis]